MNNIHYADPEAKREALLRGAMEAFAAQGFVATSMSDVAQRAGVAVGTCYRFFPAKIDLLRALHARLAAAFIAEMEAAWEAGGSSEDRLRRLVRALFALIRTRQAELRVLTMTTDIMAEGGEAPSDPVRATIARLAAQGMATGEIRTMDPDHYAALVHGLVEGAMRHHLIHDDDGTLAQTTEDMLCRAVLVARG